MDPLDVFSPRTRAWFERAFPGPTPAQELGWPAIAKGGHVLVQAPTGSGKTLAAFLIGIDRLNETPGEGLRLLYVSPLKALNYDIERNLRLPLAGVASRLSVAVRTGDTPADERRRMLKSPPDVLITTPESLFLLLTSQARENLRGIQVVILDEVHAVAGTKRGAHLAISLERLERLVEKPFQRIGLSATQRPLEEIGRFVAGTGREIELVDAGVRKELDLEVVVPVEDMRELPSTSGLSVPTLSDGVEMGVGVEQSSRSIWPSIYPAILDLVRSHRSTIVFVNNRRLAERLALRINELAGEELARAHHGSLAREQRVVVEELLKAGRIPCLVATSSLELGIDMGAVDLVIQVESPKSVARGLQRVGRAGHELHSVSKGRIFPKFRADLLESAVVARAMREGAIEETRIPRNPLDVVAQQIVAICADDEVTVDELHELVTSAYPFSDLSRAQLENVLDMLAGRYPSDEFAELRPRVVWDRARGVVRGRSGARRLAVTNAGTIPDRGLFGVFLVDGGGRVGELDEEMVYEARAGQTFLLGASSWRIEEITRDRVLVSPAPGVPGVAPFWKGEGVGRPAELGERIGRATREIAALTDERALSSLDEEYGLEQRAARNLLTYVREQEASTGVVPSDRTIVIERFRDEIGDWRVCVLSPFGGRVHAPWAMALRARLRESLGVDVQSIWSDDGIALHFPDADAPPLLADLALDPGEVEDLLLGELQQSALYGARFRENAARALLIPRRRPGQRTPLWQQRLKAQSLLQIAHRYPQFPIVLETYRECLQDVFDLPALRGILGGIQTRQLDVVDVETVSASPFASSLLFEYVATYMYEDDTPPEERRAQALSLDRDLLRELMGIEELRELLDAGAITEVEESLRRWPRNVDELHDLLRRAGPLLEGEYDPGFAETLLRERRAIRVRLADAMLLAAVEDAGLVRDAFGVAPPGGVPAVFLEPVEELARQFSDASREPAARSPRPRSPSGSTSTTPPSRSSSRTRAGGRARPRRAPARRDRARVVRSRCPQAHPSSDPGRAATRGRARGAGGLRSLPARVARDREASGAARGARATPGPRPTRDPLGERRPAATRARVPAGGSRRALRIGRARLGRCRPRPGRRLLPRGRASRRPAVGGGAPGHGGARRRSRRASVPVRCSGASSSMRRASRERGAHGALGPRLGGRGHERLVGAACARPGGTSSPTGPSLDDASHARDSRPLSHAGALVARIDAVRRGAGSHGPRRAAARAAGDRHARRRPRRGDPRWIRRGVRGAQGARDARRVSPGVLRRRARAARSSPCPAPSSGFASSGAPRGGRASGGARARRRRSGAAVRRRASVAEALGRSGRARRRRVGRPARRRGGALRRAGRPLARPAARARSGVAPAGARRARRTRASRRSEASRRRALRR